MTVLPADLCIFLPARPCLCFFYQPTMSSLSRTGIRHLVYSRHPSTVDTQIYSDSEPVEPDRAEGQEGLQIRMSKVNFKCLSLKRIYGLTGNESSEKETNPHQTPNNPAPIPGYHTERVQCRGYLNFSTSLVLQATQKKRVRQTPVMSLRGLHRLLLIAVLKKMTFLSSWLQSHQKSLVKSF